LPDGKFCLFCGDVLDESAAKAISSAPPPFSAQSLPVEPGPIEYAGFWLRVWAGSIDIFLEVFAALLVTVIVDIGMRIFSPQFGLSPITARYVTGIVFIFVLTMGAWLYCASMECSTWRATVGKRIVGLQVLSASGGQISFGQATVRHFMKFLSLFTATIGFMMAGWTKRKQALHDMPSDCVVVRVAEPSLSLFGRHS
jgi:uncharacterized RDD family membrane protein YckC